MTDEERNIDVAAGQERVSRMLSATKTETGAEFTAAQGTVTVYNSGLAPITTSQTDAPKPMRKPRSDKGVPKPKPLPPPVKVEATYGLGEEDVIVLVSNLLRSKQIRALKMVVGLLPNEDANY